MDIKGSGLFRGTRFNLDPLDDILLLGKFVHNRLASKPIECGGIGDVIEFKYDGTPRFLKRSPLADVRTFAIRFADMDGSRLRVRRRLIRSIKRWNRIVAIPKDLLAEVLSRQIFGLPIGTTAQPIFPAPPVSDDPSAFDRVAAGHDEGRPSKPASWTRLQTLPLDPWGSAESPFESRRFRGRNSDIV